MIKTIVGIDGMACNMCEAHMNDAIRKEFDVKSVKASHKDRNAVIVSEQPLEEEKIKRVVEDTGYRFLSFESAEYEKKGLFGRK